MGVNGFYKIPEVKACAKSVSYTELKGLRAVVDGNWIIRRHLYALEEATRYQFLQRARAFVHKLRLFDIKLVYSFDGSVVPWKQAEQQKRTEQKKRKLEAVSEAETKVAKKIKVLNDMVLEFDDQPLLVVSCDVQVDGSVKVNMNFVDVQSNLMELDDDNVIDVGQVFNTFQVMDAEEETEQAKQALLDANRLISLEPTKKDFELFKQLLSMLNVPIIQATYETDFVGGRLKELDQVDFFIGADSDLIWHGIDVCRMDITDPKSGEIQPIMYRVDEILESLNMDFSQMRSLCWILGLDYTKGISGVGPKIGISLMKEHQSIENIISYLIEKNENEMIKLKKKKCKTDKTIKERDDKIIRCDQAIIQIKEFKQIYDDVLPLCCDKIDHSVNWMSWSDLDQQLIDQYIESCKPLDETRS